MTAAIDSSRWRRLPFIARLFATASVALCVAGAAMLVTTARQDAAEIKHDMRAELSNELEMLAGVLAEPAVIGDYARLQQSLDLHVARPLIEAAEYRDASGVRLRREEAPLPPVAPGWFARHFGLENLRGTVPVAVGGRVYGEVELTLTAQGLANRAWTRIKAHLAILILAVAVDVAGIWLVLRSGLAPLRKIEQGADRMAAGDLAVSLTPEGSAELQSLVHSFNRMARSVREGVAAQKLVEVELRRAKEAAEAASLAKTQFLATMSHEIRTPLNGVLGLAQLLQLSGIDEGTRVAHARTIVDSGQTLLMLLNDILDLSKIEAGRIVLDATVFDPASLVEDVAALYRQIAADKGLAFECQVHDVAGLRCIGDPVRLRQMLGNLLSNAIKFTGAGGVHVEALCVAREKAEAVLGFAVVDTGIGIPEDKLQLLYRPFSQVDASMTRKFGGTGLGLSIVRKLARLMGGDVGVSTRPGEGTCFWLMVPFGLDAAAAADAPAVLSAPAGERSAGAMRVLVAEDNPTNRIVISAMLTKLGAEVKMAEDGRQSIDIVTRGEYRPDLVLMDVQMPVVDGIEATCALRRWSQECGRARLPIVALTAGAFDDDRERCMAAGMDDFLTKPVDLNLLAAVLERWRPPPTGAAAA